MVATYNPLNDPWTTPPLRDPLLESYFPNNNQSSWSNVPTRAPYTQSQRQYQQQPYQPEQQTANRGDLLQQIGTDIAIDTGINELQNQVQTRLQGPAVTSNAPASATTARTSVQQATKLQPGNVAPQANSSVAVNPTSRPAAKAVRITRNLKGIPAKIAGRLAPVVGTLATVATVANQAGETQAMGKDLGGQAAGNLVGASLGGKIGGAIGAGAGALATTATGGLAAPLVPVLTGLGAAIGGAFGASKGGEIGREVNLIPDIPSQQNASNPLFTPDASYMGRQSPMYREQLRRGREQAQDALFMRGLAKAQDEEAQRAQMILGNYLNQQNQYGQMMINAIR